jgi:transcriptional regulator with XRE-family HTH domain
MKIDYKIFRQNLVKLRAVRGMSAKDLSIEAGLRQPKRILDIEEGRGAPSLDEVCAICKVLGYKIDEMLYVDAKVTVDFNAWKS